MKYFILLTILTFCEAIEDCPKGHYRHPLKYICLPCLLCKAGEYAKESCNGVDNTICQRCPNGTYSDTETFSRRMCMNCTICKEYNSTCSSSQDASCSKKKIPGTTSSPKLLPLILTVSSLVVFVAICVLGCCWWKQRRKSHRDCEELVSMQPQDQGSTNSETRSSSDKLA